MSTATTPVTADEFRSVMAEFPSFVTVVTAQGGEGPVGCTVNAVMSMSMRPPTMAISLHQASSTCSNVLQSGKFAINLLSWDQRLLVGRFAQGDHADRFSEATYEWQEGVPILTEAAATILCSTDGTTEILDHCLIAGRVIWTANRVGADALVNHRNQVSPLLAGLVA